MADHDFPFMAGGSLSIERLAVDDAGIPLLVAGQAVGRFTLTNAAGASASILAIGDPQPGSALSNGPQSAEFGAICRLLMGLSESYIGTFICDVRNGGRIEGTASPGGLRILLTPAAGTPTIVCFPGPDEMFGPRVAFA